jgi:hypothetical protein
MTMVQSSLRTSRLKLLTKIGEAFKWAVNEVYEGDDSTFNREFRIVEDLTARANYIWNGNDLSKPPVNDGRQLYHLRNGRNFPFFTIWGKNIGISRDNSSYEVLG